MGKRSSQELLDGMRAALDALDPDVRAGRVRISGAQLILTCPACGCSNLSINLLRLRARCGCGHEVTLAVPPPRPLDPEVREEFRLRRLERQMSRNRAPDVAWAERYAGRVRDGPER